MPLVTGFVRDQFANGRRFRILNIVDAWRYLVGGQPDPVALHRAGTDAEWLLRNVTGRRMRHELLNETLFFGLDHASGQHRGGPTTTTANARILGHLTPVAYAANLTAIG